MVIFAVLIGASVVIMVVTNALPIPSFIKLFVLIIALLLDLLATSTRFYTYLLAPVSKMKGGRIVLNNDEAFVMSPSGNGITIRERNNVYATVFVHIPIYKSATEMTDQEKVDFARVFSRIVTLSRNPFKISSEMYIINKDEYINNVRSKLNEAEDNYQKLLSSKSSPPNLLERAKGQITMWHNLLESIGKAQSHALINYVAVTASGGNEEEALSLATQQAEELSAGIGAVLGATASIITGEEIYLITQPEYTIPFSTVTEQMRQKNISEGL